MIGMLSAVMVAAAFETLGVASILPFMAVALDPSVLQRSDTARTVMLAMGIADPRMGLVALGAAVVVVLIVGNAATALSLWLQQDYLARVQQQLSSELFAGYLAQPYAFHVSRDSASLTTVVFNHVSGAMNYAVTPLVTAFTRATVVAGLVSLLLLRDVSVAIISSAVLSFAYGAVYWRVRGRQAKLGAIMAAAAEERYRLVMEGFGGIKELLVLGRERATLDRFNVESGRFFRSASRNVASSVLPRYLLETVAFGGIVIVTVLLVLREGTLQAILPTLALYAFVGYRLMPALQQIFASAVAMRFAGAAVDALESDLRLVRQTRVAPLVTDGLPSRPLLNELGPEVRIESVTFTYPGAASSSLSDINLTIHPNECVALVGRTGSGKTTLVDLLLGLHEPSAGRVLVGGMTLNRATVRRWRHCVGYVSQHVFLANSSIAENIAFGLAPDDVNHAAVRRAANLAQVDEFIRSLPEGFETIVGERGVKLSGGQRQRLGIARALYNDPAVLVFDEATSALDGMTEEAVMEAVRTLSATRTIVLVAHRMRTVEACDRLFVLDHGRLVAQGSYAELYKQSPEFRLLTGRAVAMDAVV